MLSSFQLCHQLITVFQHLQIQQALGNPVGGGEIKVGKAFNIFLPIICKHCQSIDIVELSIALPSKPVPDIGSKYLSPLQKSNCQVGDGREAHIAAITPYPSAPLLANLSCLCKSPCLWNLGSSEEGEPQAFEHSFHCVWWVLTLGHWTPNHINFS